VCVSADGNKGEMLGCEGMSDNRARFLCELKSQIESPNKAAPAKKFKDDMLCASF
jgi:hypothetical protein